MKDSKGRDRAKIWRMVSGPDLRYLESLAVEPAPVLTCLSMLTVELSGLHHCGTSTGNSLTANFGTRKSRRYKRACSSKVCS